MNTLSAVLLVATLLVALFDWWAVHAQRRDLEYVAKPLTLVLLIGVAVTLDPLDDTVRWWFVAALVWSLLGDVALMLPDRRRFFPIGLGAFLIGHLAFVGGLLIFGQQRWWLVAGLLVVGLAVATLGRRIVAGVRAAEPALALPVAAYVAVISVMVISAFGTGRLLAIAGALSFYASDALIAWTNFMVERAWGRLAVMVTYHVAQVLLVLALVW